MRRVPMLGAALLAATAVSLVGALGDDGGAVRSLVQAGSPAADVRALDPAAPTGWGPTAGELERAHRAVEGMALEARVATVLMPGFWGYDGERPTAAESIQNRLMHGVGSAVEVAGAQSYGGFFLRPEVLRDATQVARLTRQLHRAGDHPDGLSLLLSIDQEGGTVQRLRAGVPAVPAAARVGASGDPAYARRVARQNGRTLRALGVTMVLAPVADVDPDGSSVVGSRAYSADPRKAADMVVATVEGYLQAGVIPVVKHFPGLGTVRGDSHRTLPVQRKSVAELMGTDLVPFRAAIDAGAPVVMSGHVAVPAVERGMPASLSRPLLEGVLRKRLGFHGVLITDSQGMGPIHGRFGPAEGAVRSLLAGNDLVLNSPRPQAARQAVIRAVRTGRLSERRVTEAATRVVALRLFQQRLAAAAG